MAQITVQNFQSTDLQLAEKQKLRFSYGLSEKQFRNLFVQATKVKGGTLGFKLYDSFGTSS